jgi:hypothetical protein
MYNFATEKDFISIVKIEHLCKIQTRSDNWKTKRPMNEGLKTSSKFSSNLQNITSKASQTPSTFYDNHLDDDFVNF